MPAADFEHEPVEASSLASSPERRLWAEALGQLIRDASAYWRGVDQPGAPPAHELEAAFDDLCRCGPMTRKCCAWLDVDPATVSARFIRWVEARDYNKSV